MRRSLSYFWRIHLAVVLGSSVATSILTGALLVGDSVRGSLRDLSLDRLGRIEFALQSERFFREDLAGDLSSAVGFAESFESATPVILLSGSVKNASTQARASRVLVQGVDERFISLFDKGPRSSDRGVFLSKPKGQMFSSVAINEALKRELGVEIGDAVVLSLERPAKIHREFLFGMDDPEDITQALRLVVSEVIPNRGLGRFGLHPHQSLHLNAFVSLPVLQKSLGLSGQVNSILVAAGPADADAGALRGFLKESLVPEDLGLVFREKETYVSVESTSFLLKPGTARRVGDWALENSVPSLPVLTYLANSLRVGDREIPYSTIAAMDTDVLEDGGPFGAFREVRVSAQLDSNEGGIILNEWAARDLRAAVGDSVTVSYYLVGPREELLTREARFRLEGVVAVEGLAADPTLTPEFPGIQDADRMSSWEAPFPVDLRRIREEDEAYWEEHRSTPKAFVALSVGQQLWESRFGSLSAIRLGTREGIDAKTLVKRLRQDLPRALPPESVGLSFRPVRREGIDASSGATDFSMLFIGFSQFLIVSAALLVGLLYRLGVEQRVGEAGILLASGYPIAGVRKRFLVEGSSLAVIGGGIGLLGALFYGWLMMVGLRTLWVSAIGTSHLSLYVDWVTLLIGYCASVGVVVFTIWRTVRHLGKTSVRSLLSGTSTLVSHRSGKVARRLGVVSLVMAACLVLAGRFTSDSSGVVGMFFGSGAFLLIAGISFTSIWLRRQGGDGGVAPRRVLSLGLRNSARLPGRSLLCTSLIACACFVIVAVGANRRTQTGALATAGAPGTGGFALLAEADVPIHSNLNAQEDRYGLGFADEESKALEECVFYPFRVLPGDDVSCLNLYRPETPRVLGVPAELIDRGGFQFQQTLQEIDHPWELLSQDLGPGVIPAVGDFNSVMWILQKSIGDDVEIRSENGQVIKLRLVGLLSTSIFQGELLISEANFLEHFPGRSGYGFHLIDAPADQAVELSGVLERRLGEWGYDVTSTARRLADYRAVENTYLSTFQTLGGLGLILGTIGLGVVLLRNALERKRELAVMQSFGFRRQSLSLMLLAENGFLLVLGILIGTLSALLAVSPHLLAPGGAVPWSSLALTLALVFLTGLTTTALAAHLILKTPLLPALKEDH